MTSERQHALIVLDDLIQNGAEYRHGGIIYPRLSPPTTQCNLHYIKLISPRFEIENYSTEHVLLNFNEECQGCLAGDNTESAMLFVYVTMYMQNEPKIS